MDPRAQFGQQGIGHPCLLKTGAELIAEERQKQLAKWSRDHDDEHSDGSLAVIAARLAVAHTDAQVVDPLERSGWGLLVRHRDKVRRLAIAGALIAAEIDRIQRKD